MLFSDIAVCGIIRNVHMNANKMQPIYLKMGQSTVLRFKEKPKKVVVGNQNYYSVEFIDNDITIQPQGRVKTNLFVYGQKNHVYGFILTVDQKAVYDDLVNVSWTYANAYSIQQKKAKPKKYKVYKINRTITVQDISLKIEKIWYEERLGVYILDSILTNNSDDDLESRKIELSVTRNNRKLPSQEHAFFDDLIKSKSKTKVRSLIRLKERKGFSFYLEKGGKRKRIIISKGLL